MPGRYDDGNDRGLRRRRKPPSTVRVVALVGSLVGGVVLLAVVLAVSGGRGGGGAGGGGFGPAGLLGSAVSYQDFKAIHRGDTLEGLEQRFGRAARLDRADWAKPLRVGPESAREAGSLAAYSRNLHQVEAWYRWRGGSEDVYIAVGVRDDGRRGLVAKGYTNAAAMRQNAARGDPDRPDLTNLVPAFEFGPVD